MTTQLGKVHEGMLKVQTRLQYLARVERQMLVTGVARRKAADLLQSERDLERLASDIGAVLLMGEPAANESAMAPEVA